MSAPAWLTPLLAILAFDASAIELPATCAEDPLVIDSARSVTDLRAEVVSSSDTDPHRAVQILCAAIPRVEREYGAESLELAWWVGSLATPLIAYLDRHAEALPLLDFAEPIFARELGPHASEVADIHVAHAWINIRKGSLEASGAAWERALVAREHNPGERQIELQKVLVGLAQVRLAQRNFDAARQALLRAEAILAANGETVSEAAAAIASAFAALALREEDFPSARRHAERLLEIEHAMASPAAQLVAGYAMLGQILERLDEFEAAERALREAIRLAEADDAAAPLQRHLLAALTQLAATLADRGKARQAAPFAERAVGVAEATLGADAPRLVRVLDVRAEVHRALGELPSALRAYERGTTLLDAHAGDVEKPTQVAHFRGLGALYASLGDDRAARAALAHALEIAGDDPTLEAQRAGVLLTLGEQPLGQTYARRRGHLETGIDLLSRKLPDSHPAILRAVNELCGLELRDAAAPAPHCDDAAKRLDAARSVEPALVCAVRANQSQRAEQAGRIDDAYALAIDALAAAESLGTPEPRWRAYFRLARLLHQRGDAPLAIFFGKRSLADIEQLRSFFVDDDRRFDRSFLADKVSVYRAVADWLMGTGRIDEGLDVLRLLKTEELHDFIMRNARDTSSVARVSWTSAEEALLEAYRTRIATDPATGAKIDRLGRLSRDARISVTEAAQLDALLTDQTGTRRTLNALLHTWLAEHAASGRTATADPVVHSRTIARERDRYGEDAALAVYLLTDRHLRILVATSQGVTVTETPLDGAALRRGIGAFLDALTDRRSIEVAGGDLYELLAEPVDRAARAAGAKRLVLWLDGALRYVPFAALGDGAVFLGDRYALEIYSPSRSQLRPVAARDHTRTTGIRGLGVTRAVSGYAALPGIAEELCSIIRGPIEGLEATTALCAEGSRGSGMIDGAGFVDAAFTESRLRQLLEERSEFTILHLGTHFALRPGNSLRSFLLLGDGTRLTLDAMNQFDFGGIGLVTLSACQTGLGGAIADDGREVEGLSSLVQRQGASRVIASLWHVEDTSTAHLMRQLYSAFAVSSDAASALQIATQRLRENPRYRHPYFWAGFVVAGRDD